MAKIYKMTDGTVIDMEKLKLQNERAIAAGNMKVNAKGDEIDSRGNVTASAASRSRGYHSTVQKTETRNVSLKEKVEETVKIDEPAPAPTPEVPTARTKTSVKRKTKKNEIELPDGSIQVTDTEDK